MKKSSLLAILASMTVSFAFAAGTPAQIQAAQAKLAADTVTLQNAQTKYNQASQALVGARAHPQNYAAYRQAALNFNTADANLKNAVAAVNADSANLAALQA